MFFTKFITRRGIGIDFEQMLDIKPPYAEENEIWDAYILKLPMCELTTYILRNARALSEES